MTTFKSDDGREIDEADLRYLVEYVDSWRTKGAERVLVRVEAALKPKPAPTCGAVIPQGFAFATRPLAPIRCVLPPPDKQGFHEGHHAYLHVVTVRCCAKPESDPVHWKGHSPSPEVWQEP